MLVCSVSSVPAGRLLVSHSEFSHGISRQVLQPAACRFLERVCDQLLELHSGQAYLHAFGGYGSYAAFTEVCLQDEQRQSLLCASSACCMAPAALSR